MAYSMHFFLCIFVLPLSYALQLCPILGPSYPFPSKLASSQYFQEAISNLTDTIDDALVTGNSSHGKVDDTAAYSIQLFSVGDPEPIFEKYHHGASISNITGTQTINGDAIYRIGSVSKLWTVYALLAEIGDMHWDQRLTDLIPELQSHNKSGSDPVSYVAWNQVTLGALAGQVAGIARDYVANSKSGNSPVDLGGLGFPALDPSESQPCIWNSTNMCNRTEFFQNIDFRQPTWAPNTTPIYSNTAFGILAYAMESITGKSYKQLIQGGLIDPLNLTSSSVDEPDVSGGVVPYNVSTSGWNMDLGDVYTSAGGIYSSANNMAALGRSILNSTLLDPNTTRAWLKPTTHTASLYMSVGRPWEIYRMNLHPSDRVLDMYTKAGDIGLYHSHFVLLPDYGVGWVSLAAGAEETWINGIMADIIIPALEESARGEADANYAGTYTATGAVNSSITFTTDPDKSGLGISQFVSNGTDMLALMGKLLFGVPSDQVSSRMYPTNLQEKTGNGTEVAFRAVYEQIPESDDQGPFAACFAWAEVDALNYGRHSTDQFVFTLDDDGKVVSVSAVDWKIDLVRNS